MRYLPVLLLIGLEIFALIDCIQTRQDEARHLPKIAWIILIVIAPLVGALAWLFAGRPRGAKADYGRSAHPSNSSRYNRQTRPLGPDDDVEFLEQLRRQDIEHQRMLKKWEEDLRRREGDLGNDSGSGGDGSNPPAR